ncbi:9561_t:CDS:1, partial [Gigaspora rosea]
NDKDNDHLKQLLPERNNANSYSLPSIAELLQRRSLETYHLQSHKTTTITEL